MTIPPAAKRHVIRRMWAAVSKHYMSVIIAKPDQGKVFEATSRHGASNRFMRQENIFASLIGASCTVRVSTYST